MPEDETSNPPPYDPSSMFWEGDTSTGAKISQWERDRWERFLAQIVSATSDAGVLGNFPEGLEQEVERLRSRLTSAEGWNADLEAKVQELEQKIGNLGEDRRGPGQLTKL